MLQQFDTLRKTRGFLSSVVDGLSAEQLNKIPDGYSNNIIWNMAHLVAAMQGICYRRAGLEEKIDPVFFDAYKPGSRPAGDVSGEEIAAIKSLLVSSVDELEADYNKGIFSSYTPWTSRYEVTISSVEDGLEFVAYHEGLHTGFIMALKKLVVAPVVI